MSDTSPQESPLRHRMIEDMTVRNLSAATQRSYIHAVKKFSRCFNRSPDRLGLEDVRTFQVHLVSTRISRPALNQTVCALRFFYGVTLGSAEIPERIAYARKPRKLPVVLNRDKTVLHLARQKRFAAHRVWMMRSAALTFADVTLRLWLPLQLVAGIPFETACAIVAWLCWVPNLIVAHYLLKRTIHSADAQHPIFNRPDNLPMETANSPGFTRLQIIHKRLFGTQNVISGQLGSRL